MRPNIEELAEMINQRSLAIWIPGSLSVIDESLYEYRGSAPVHVYDIFCVTAIH